jgi:hypothetical protein
LAGLNKENLSVQLVNFISNQVAIPSDVIPDTALPDFGGSQDIFWPEGPVPLSLSAYMKFSSMFREFL